MMTCFEHLAAPIFDALPHLTTVYHIYHITTSSTPTTLHLQHHDMTMTHHHALRTANTAGYHYHYNYTTPTTTYYHFNYY